MADVSVTINPPNSTSVTIGNAVSAHGATHAPGSSDSLENYYYPRTNPSGYATSGDFATTGYVGEVSGYLNSQISFPSNVVFTTGGQTIDGLKNFSIRPTINGTGVLLSGEASIGNTGYLTGYVQKTETGEFYPRSNPSGYITGVNLSAYQTISASTGISGYLQNQISAINLSSGQFLTTGAADSRYVSVTVNIVTGDVVRPSETGSFLTGETDPIFTSSTAYGINSTLTGQWGDSYNDSITGLSVSGSSSKTITLYQRDGSTLTASFSDIEGTGAGTDYFLTGSSFNSANGNLNLYVNNGSVIEQSLDGRYVTGAVVRPSETGEFLVSGDLDSYQTIAASTGISGYLQSQISSINSSTGLFVTGQVVRPSQTGSFLTGVDLSTYATIALATGISGYQSGLISSLYDATGLYALKSSTGSFLTTGAADLRFYPLSSNPSGYLTASSIADLATTGYVTGVSGHLQSQVLTLNSFSGQSITGYNRSITGLSIGGSTTKTITLFQQNGSTLTADFSDLQGTGGGGSSDNSVLLTGDQNISGVKNFYSRPTVNGTGVLLSGEAYSSSFNGIQWNLISTTTISNNSSISVQLTGGYNRYMIGFKNVYLSDNGYALRARCSSDGGSSYFTGTDDYSYGYNIVNGYTPAQLLADHIVLVPLLSAKPSGGCFGELVFDSLGEASMKPSCKWNIYHEYWNNSLISYYLGASFVNRLTGINAVQFFASLGNLSGGSLNVYGSNY